VGKREAWHAVGVRLKDTILNGKVVKEMPNEARIKAKKIIKK
jgi:hypothetical protein